MADGKPGRGLRTKTARFLGGAFDTGFDQYGGELSAGLSPELLNLFSSFFAPGGGLESALGATQSFTEKDALARAQELLSPLTDIRAERFRRSSKEKASASGNLLSSTAQEAEDRGVADIFAGEGATLAGLLPAFEQMRIMAAQAAPQILLQALAAGEQERGVRQSALDRDFAEFLRTAPASAGGQILNMILQANAARRQPSGQQRQRGPTGFQDFTSFLAAVAPIAGAAITAGV